MSYEGYSQCICFNGHYSEMDVYAEREDCECGASFAWTNSVDSTNGDEVGIIPMGVLDEKYRTDRHDNQGEDIYDIPKAEDTQRLRCRVECDSRSVKVTYIPLLIEEIHGT